jgi:hypothetical protein
MLQTSPETARIQIFLAKEECDWNSSHHMDYSPEDLGSSSEINTVPPEEHWLFILPPTRNYPLSLLRLNPEFQILVYLVC